MSVNNKEEEAEVRQSFSGGNSPHPSPNKAREEYHAVQNDLSLMRNRVNLLRQQLQKEKDSVKKHRSMTQQVVQKKAEISKVNSLKNRDNSEFEERAAQIRERNHSYRRKHKEEMNNILKAIYLVKLDEARSIKEASMEHRRSREQLQESMAQRHKERKRAISQQSEQAKARYIEYWKHKLNSIYTKEQESLEEQGMLNQERKKELGSLQEEELELLNQIKQMQKTEMEAKKEYMAALSLSSREVGEAVKAEKQEKNGPALSQAADPGSLLAQSRSESIRYSKVDPLERQVPNSKLLSSNDISLPRTKLDNDKFQVVLKELRRLEEVDRKKKK